MTVIGIVTIVAGGTPQPILAVNTAAARFQRVRLQANPANVAEIYVGTAAMNTGTGAGVAGVVGIPGATGELPVFDFGGYGLPAGMDLSQIYVDGATGESVYVCAI